MRTGTTVQPMLLGGTEPILESTTVLRPFHQLTAASTKYTRPPQTNGGTENPDQRNMLLR
jgi:hypothetical protein